MNVSFTGNRDGMTDEQKATLRRILSLVFEEGSKFTHGKCKGSDEQAAAIACDLGYVTVARPSTLAKWTSDFVSDIEYDPEEPLDRNRMVVLDGDILVGTPKETYEPEPARGQGTWSTVRYSRKVDVPCVGIWPDGEAATFNDGPIPISLQELVGRVHDHH